MAHTVCYLVKPEKEITLIRCTYKELANLDLHLTTKACRIRFAQHLIKNNAATRVQTMFDSIYFHVFVALLLGGIAAAVFLATNDKQATDESQPAADTTGTKEADQAFNVNSLVYWSAI